MYLEKIGKELKANPIAPEDKSMRTSLAQIPRKLSKVGNTTSTSLQRFAPAPSPAPSPAKEQNSTVKTAFYNHEEKMDSITSREEVENEEPRDREREPAENGSAAE
jgi:hypothetical protein